MWILLKPDDTIQPGDEVFNEAPWELVDHSLVGQRVEAEIIRRRLTGWEAVEHAIRTEVLGNNREGCETTSLFWDCKCERDYIHDLDLMVCEICGAEDYAQPHSRKAEVLLKIIEENRREPNRQRA